MCSGRLLASVVIDPSQFPPNSGGNVNTLGVFSRGGSRGEGWGKRGCWRDGWETRVVSRMVPRGKEGRTTWFLDEARGREIEKEKNEV